MSDFDYDNQKIGACIKAMKTMKRIVVFLLAIALIFAIPYFLLFHKSVTYEPFYDLLGTSGVLTTYKRGIVYETRAYLVPHEGSFREIAMAFDRVHGQDYHLDIDGDGKSELLCQNTVEKQNPSLKVYKNSDGVIYEGTIKVIDPDTGRYIYTTEEYNPIANTIIIHYYNRAGASRTTNKIEELPIEEIEFTYKPIDFVKYPADALRQIDIEDGLSKPINAFYGECTFSPLFGDEHAYCLMRKEYSYKDGQFLDGDIEYYYFANEQLVAYSTGKEEALRFDIDKDGEDELIWGGSNANKSAYLNVYKSFNGVSYIGQFTGKNKIDYVPWTFEYK